MSGGEAGEARYRFGPLERKGVVAGLGGGQVACLGLGLVVAVASLRFLGPPFNMAVALGAVAVGLSAAFIPFGGRTIEEWVPAVSRWAAGSVTGSRRWRECRHLRGVKDTEPGRQPPPLLRGCRLIDHDGSARGDGSRMGVVLDGRAGVYSAGLAVAGGGFALLDRSDKERRLAAWSSVLSGLAREGTVVHRVQWIERSQPGDAASLGLSMAERLDPDAPAGAARSYAELIERAGPVTPRHETLVVVSVAPARIRRQVRGAGGGEPAALELLAREVALLQSNLRSAEIEVRGVLGPLAMRQALAAGFCGGETHWRSPWPVAVETGWSSVRVDGAWHATYWVAEWPRSDVGPDFLVPLLLLSSAVRAVSVTMEPVSPARAAREVESARTAGAADEELRRRGGFIATARRQRQADGMARRETELADGHADFRFSGYVTVTAADAEQLERHCSEVEHASAQSRLELRRLYGQQDEALTFTLPMGRGLR